MTDKKNAIPESGTSTSLRNTMVTEVSLFKFTNTLEMKKETHRMRLIQRAYLIVYEIQPAPN